MVATSKEEALYLFEFGENYDSDLYDSFEEAVDGEVSSTVYGTLTIEGDEYLVFDDLEDAEQMAIRDIENLIDDIENEESSDDEIYLNRLHEEMCDYGIMEEMDLEDKDDDEIEMIKSNIESEIETKKDEFVEKLCDEYDNSKEWFEENFGRDELLRVISENEVYDKYEVAEYIVDMDGLGHILASYDGEEHEQDGYLIYRVVP